MTVASLLSLTTLIIAGSLDGILSDAVYALAFIIPVSLGLLLDKRDPYEERDERLYLLPTGEGAALTLPCILPTVAAVMLASYLTSLLIKATTGAVDSVNVGDDLLLAALRHAVMPAILEEALYRYLPLKLFGRDAPRAALILSSVFFAFAHVSLFSIPYALIAGAAFMLLDLIFESVLPSFILHLVNNICSLLLIFYGDSQSFVVAAAILFSLLLLLSLCFIIFRRKRYLELIRDTFRGAEQREASYTPLLFIIPAAFIALTEFL